jgi:hypothetical protein
MSEVDPRPNDPQPSDAPPWGDDGVDVSLIRWLLAMTPAERLRALQGYVDSVLQLRGDGAAS